MSDRVTTLTLVSDARRALSEAKTLPDIRRIMAAAAVTVDAQRRRAKLLEASGAATDVVHSTNDAANDMAAVRIEAQAAAGEILILMAERGERAKSGVNVRPGQEYQRVILDDLGISGNESARWQTIAAIPAPIREEYVAEVKEDRAEVTTAGLVRFHLERQAADHGHLTADLLVNDPKAERLRVRSTFATVRHVLRRDLLPLKPELVERIYNRTEMEELLTDIADWRLWCDRVESVIQASSGGVIDGRFHARSGHSSD